MRAVRIHDDLSLRVDDIDDLTPGRGEVLVRVHAAGVCGTDLHILDGMIKPDPYPMTLGHEAAGIVEVAGEGASLTPGTPRGDLQQDLLRTMRAVPEGSHEHLRQRARSARLQPRRRRRGLRRGPGAERGADPRGRRPGDRGRPHVRRHDRDARDEALATSAWATRRSSTGSAASGSSWCRPPPTPAHA